MLLLQVEAVLIASPYVDSIMLHADSFHSYCVAIVVASQPTLEGWALKQGIAFVDFTDLCQKPETVKEVHGSLMKVIYHNVCVFSLSSFPIDAIG